MSFAVGRLCPDEMPSELKDALQAGPRPWVVPAVEDAAVQRLAKQAGCPVTIAALLVARGIVDPAAAHAFFQPILDDLIDPMLMLGMELAVARIQRAVHSGESILIYGDYDVDGTIATVLLKKVIERIAAKDRPAIVSYHVPHRIHEGYGMQTGVLGQAAAAGVGLVISVDTGIRAFAAAEEARALGMDLIVTDHHLPDGNAGIPEAVAVLNPAQPDCPYPFKSLCGAGVAFKLAHALLSAAAQNSGEPQLQQDHHACLKQRILPSLLKLVAIATIADSVPLEGENRVIASLGLRELHHPIQPGLRALMRIAQIPIDRPPTATEIGFRLAPRINAAGRMDIASDVVELFLTRDVEQAASLAEKLNRLNEDRRATEAKALEAIERQLDTSRQTLEGDDALAHCIILDDPDWHRGVLGILASRVVDRTGRPALVLTHHDGQAHGSGRSIDGFHLLDALTAVHQAEAESADLFTRFGGHAHAVGFSLPSERVPLLRERMLRYGAGVLTQSMLAPPLHCDAEVQLSELTQEFFDWLTRCEPFGMAHREPVFLTRGLTLAAPVRLIPNKHGEDKHICLQLEQPGRSERFSALGWSRILDWPARCAALALAQGSVVDAVYRVKAKGNPQFPGLELELADLQLAASSDAER